MYKNEELSKAFNKAKQRSLIARSFVKVKLTQKLAWEIFFSALPVPREIDSCEVLYYANKFYENKTLSMLHYILIDATTNIISKGFGIITAFLESGIKEAEIYILFLPNDKYYGHYTGAPNL